MNVNDITSEYATVTIENDKRKIEIFRVKLDPEQDIIDITAYDTAPASYQLRLSGSMETVNGVAFKYTLKDHHIDGEIVQETRELES